MWSYGLLPHHLTRVEFASVALELYEQNAAFPVGKGKVEVYLDGMLVGTKAFEVVK